jgi:2-polyprenyl-6-methoxyphenol hydroxylase-like FAD-dependent oxidoreductase
VLPSRFPYLLITPQFNVEDLLLARARKAGVKIVDNAEVVRLDQDATGVTVTTKDATYRASYVVGADGFHSAVREAIGQPFPGRSVVKSIMLADVLVAEEPAELLTVNGVGDAFAFIAPFGDGYYRVFTWDRRRSVPDSEPLTLDEVREVTKRALGTDFGMHDARWLSRFHSDERQAPQYRVGRIFLAGDAAHVHSPAGGQGMNTGIQDAANLSWKLAAVLRGAPDSLLDTYQAERHPVGRSVLRSSGALIRAAMIKSRFGQAVRGIVARRLLSIPKARAKATGQLSGIGYHYGAPAGAHELVGTRAADVPLADGGRLYEALRGQRFVVLGDADVKAWGDQVTAVAPATPGGPLVLVRPDGYVGWAGTDTAQLHEAIAAHAGPPRA